MEKYFDGYFETLTHLERMRQFYHETLYKCLYHYYYEPIDETDRDPEQCKYPLPSQITLFLLRRLAVIFSKPSKSIAY